MNKNFGYIQLLIIGIILIFINVIASHFSGFIDLTEEKRFTISTSTQDVVEKIDDALFIRVLLKGDFPPGFKRLQRSTETLLEDFHGMNPRLEYVFEDPTDGTADEIKARRDQLAEDGIIPTNLSYYDGKEYVQKAIYPYALISYKGRFSAVNLLQEQAAGQNEQEVLNRSIELLEYKFANIFQKLTAEKKQNIVLTAGQGELTREQTVRLETELRQYYNVGRIVLDSVVALSNQIDLLMVAGPQQRFSEKNKFKIDQYIMNGGKVIWMLDHINANLDSINKYRFYVPEINDYNLSDLTFKYGFRLEPNLILDLESSSIPQIVGEQGGKPQTSLFNWFYHVLATPRGNHPITKNIGRVNVFNPSTVDTVRTELPLKRTVLLSSSDYSRFQLHPMRLNFEILKLGTDPDKFDKDPQPIAVLAEGRFSSLYKNRLTPEFEAGLNSLDIEFKSTSPETKQMFISDSEFIINNLNYRTEQADLLGYNKWDRKYYSGNNAFILNTIEYFLGDAGILDARSKEVKLRLLNQVKTEKEETKWQIINIVLPIFLLVVFGILFNYIRKRKYT